MFIKDISSITKLIFLIICYFLLQTSFANELKKSNYKKLKEIEEKLLINQEIYFELIKLEKELVLNLNNVNKNIKKYNKLIDKGFSEKKYLEKIILSRKLDLEKQKKNYLILNNNQRLMINNMIVAYYKYRNDGLEVESKISKNILEQLEKNKKKYENRILSLEESIQSNQKALNKINVSLKNIELALNERSNELEGLIGESIINEIQIRENKIQENKITRQANKIKSLIENFEKKQIVAEPFGKFIFKKLTDILPVNQPLIKDIKTAKLKTGVLLSIKNDTTLKAPKNSLVVYADFFKGYGKMIILDLGSDYHLILSGVSNILCNTGDWLEKGGLIGDIVMNDNKEFYMEFRFKGKTINPSKWARS